MKKRILFVVVLLLTHFMHSQEMKWETYDVDSIVSVNMPGAVYNLDTIIRGQRMFSMQSEQDTEVFQASILHINQNIYGLDAIQTPKNDKDLESMYSDVVFALMELTEFEFQGKKSIVRNGLKGRKTMFSAKNSDLITWEFDVIYLKNKIYVFSYANVNGVQQEQKVRFFDSIQFNEAFDLSQYPNNPFDLKTGIFWKVIIGLILLSFLARFWSKRRQTSNDY